MQNGRPLVGHRIAGRNIDRTLLGATFILVGDALRGEFGAVGIFGLVECDSHVGRADHVDHRAMRKAFHFALHPAVRPVIAQAHQRHKRGAGRESEAQS